MVILLFFSTDCILFCKIFVQHIEQKKVQFLSNLLQREGHPLEAVLVALESAAPCQWAVEQPSLTTILTSPTMVHLLHVVSR